MTLQFLAVLWLFLFIQRVAIRYETGILHKPRGDKEKADKKDGLGLGGGSWVAALAAASQPEKITFTAYIHPMITFTP